MLRTILILAFLQLPAQSQETTVWIGKAENITKGTTGLSELELTVEGSRVTGYWRFLPNVEHLIEEGRIRDGVAHWWHRKAGDEEQSFEIILYLSPDGETALCDYWGHYPDPKNDTRGYIRYSLVRRDI